MSELPRHHEPTPVYTDSDGLIRMPNKTEQETAAAIRREREAREQAAAAEQRTAWQERYRRDKWKGRMKKAMTATALLATVKSGGFIDMAADPFSDAGEIARGAIDVPAMAIPDKIDGIKFTDYPADVREEYVAEEQDRLNDESLARRTVVDLFDRADQEGYHSIVQETLAERQSHPELYQSPEIVERTSEAIDEAASNEQAVESLNEFMQFYSIDASFHDEAFDDKQGELKEALTAYVKVFSALPKDFIELAGLKRITVSDRSVSSSNGIGSEGGTYSSDENAINIVIRGNMMNVGAAAEAAFDGDDYSYESTIAHEVGHALSEHQPVGSYLEDDELVNLDTSTPAGALFGGIARNHLNRPNHMSLYGRSSSEENTAEVLSGVLSDRDNGLATVDEWRRFGSAANKSMIDMLAQLESIRPGIAKILIANRVS